MFEPAYVAIDALQTSCIEEGEEGLCNTLQYVLLELPPGLVDARGCMCLSLFVDITWFVHPCVGTEDITKLVWTNRVLTYRSSVHTYRT